MKNFYLKIIKNILFIIIFMIVINIAIISKSIAVNTANTAVTTEQKAIQEVANAYYNRQTNGQYCSYRKSFLYSPEEATSQHTIYSVCSDFTYSVYYQAFGIQIQDTTSKIMEYASEYYDMNNTTNDVIEFWHKDTDDNGNIVYYDNNENIKDINLSTATGRKNYANTLLTTYNLQIGDVICYRAADNTTGHALLVYDIIYDDNGNPVDAIIRESNSKYETKTTKVTKGFSYAEIENQITGVTEGTFQELYLANTYTRTDTSTKNALVYNIRNCSYFTILRPLLKDEEGNYTGQYYYSNITSNSSSVFGQKSEGRTLKNYEISETSLNRIKYSSIYIEKTVDVFNNSIVGLEDTLEYTIKVKNDSNEKYEKFDIIENISEYVNIQESGNGSVDGNTINWTIQNLEAGSSIEIKYKVKVKNSISILGKQIVSTGTVAGIPSTTVTNSISSNLDNSEKNKISSQTQNLLNDKEDSGQELINKIYNDSLGFSLNLENFDITNLIDARNGVQYYPEGNTSKSTIYLNNNNEFSDYILSGYYGAIYTNTSTNMIYQKYWENTSSKINGRSERKDTIYEENFQTGDILVYKNKQTTNENVTYETEDGIYYLIYIEDSNKITINGNELSGFIGVDENGDLKIITNDFTNLRTLLGKDYYVVFRPSIAFATERERKITKIELTTPPIKVNYIQNYEDLDLTGGILTVTYNDESKDTISLTNENVKVTGFNNSTIGTNTITVEYGGKVSIFEIRVIANNNIENTEDMKNDNTDSKQIDDSVSKTILPNAGTKRSIIILSICVLCVITITLYRKNKELKDIK